MSEIQLIQALQVHQVNLADNLADICPAVGTACFKLLDLLNIILQA